MKRMFFKTLPITSLMMASVVIMASSAQALTVMDVNNKAVSQAATSDNVLTFNNVIKSDALYNLLLNVDSNDQSIARSVEYVVLLDEVQRLNHTLDLLLSEVRLSNQIQQRALSAAGAVYG